MFIQQEHSKTDKSQETTNTPTQKHSHPKARSQHQQGYVVQRAVYAFNDVQNDLPHGPTIRYQTATVSGMNVARRVEAKGLHLGINNTGTSTQPATSPQNHSAMYNTIRNNGQFAQFRPHGVNLYDLYGGQATHDAHLLTERFHGQAIWENLALAPAEVNMALRGIEWQTHERMLKQNQAGHVFDWEAVVNYGRANMPTDFENAFPTSIEVRATPQQLNAHQWRDDPDAVPTYRKVTVNVARQGQAADAANSQDNQRNSPFTQQERTDRARRGVFLSDDDAGNALSAPQNWQLNNPNTRNIQSDSTEDADFVYWTNATVNAYFSDQNIAAYKNRLISILQRNLDQHTLPSHMKIGMQQTVDGYKNKNDDDFDPAQIRNLGRTDFFTNHYRTNGAFPQTSVDAAFFWVEQTFEGVEENWFDEKYGWQIWNVNNIDHVIVTLEDLSGSTPGVNRADSVSIFLNDDMQSEIDADYLVDNFQSSYGTVPISNHVAGLLGINSNKIIINDG